MANKTSLQARFAADRSGNFAVMTTLLAVPLFVAAGCVLDYSTASLERNNMQGIADSAALAGGRVFDGTNTAAAKAAAKTFLDGYSSRMPPGVSYDIIMNGQSIQVSLQASVATSLMQVAGISTIPVGVSSHALTPYKPQSIKFTPTQAQGYYYKKVSIIVVRPNSTKEEVVGTVTYQPTTHSDNGQGTMTVLPSSTLNLGKYSKLVLQMDIKNDGCGIGFKAAVTGSTVSCQANGVAASNRFNLTLRTDNPDTSQYLFVNKVQLPKGVMSPLEEILECDRTLNHAWEDGGGWERQDFFYTAASVCAPDGQFVRLTK